MMHVAPFVKLRPAYRRSGVVNPVDAKRASLLKLRAKLTRTLYDFLQRQGKLILGHIVVARSHFAKADSSPDEQDLINRIMSSIDFAGWATLVGEVEPVLQEIVKDGSIAALLQVHLDVEGRRDVVNVVSRDAVAYAKDRAAEMVGMRRDALGRLVPNPDAEWAITEPTRDGVRQYVESAITEGWSNAKLADELGTAYAFSKDRALVIARTETNMASNRGALNGYKASGLVSGVEWLTADDDRVSEECEANGDAGVLPVGEPFPSGDDAPPVHPNCLLADSLVSPCGRVSASSDRWYDGEIITIRTASGKHIACTPNHPILTSHGWVAARLLDETMDVVCAREWNARGNDNDDHVVARIEDIAKSLGRAKQVSVAEVPLTAKDFHGDVAIWNNDVAVIRTNRELRNEVGTKRGSNFDFKVADVQAFALHRLRSLNFLGKRVLSSAHCFVSVACLRLALALRHAFPLHAFGFGLIAAGNAGCEQTSCDSRPSHAELFGDLVFGRAGKVFVDDVVDVQVGAFAGHVFNLETETGYYVANGILTHNCRCTLSPVVIFDTSPEEVVDE